ncbi:hypothetical protein JCM10450v2_005050 [Rhodotorula kratochvilovae]
MQDNSVPIDTCPQGWATASQQLPTEQNVQEAPIAPDENSENLEVPSRTPTPTQPYGARWPVQPEQSAMQEDEHPSSRSSHDAGSDHHPLASPEDLAAAEQAQQDTVDAFVQAVAEGSDERSFLLLEILNELGWDVGLINRSHSGLELPAAALAGSSSSTEHELLFQILLLAGAYIPEDAIAGFMTPGWLPLTAWARATAKRFVNGDLSGFERAQTLFKLSPEEIAAYLAHECVEDLEPGPGANPAEYPWALSSDVEITEKDRLDADMKEGDGVAGSSDAAETGVPGSCLPDEPRYTGTPAAGNHLDRASSLPIGPDTLTSLDVVSSARATTPVPSSTIWSSVGSNPALALARGQDDADDDASSVSSFATVHTRSASSELASEFSAFELVDGAVSGDESDASAAGSFVHLRLEDAK